MRMCERASSLAQASVRLDGEGAALVRMPVRGIAVDRWRWGRWHRFGGVLCGGLIEFLDAMLAAEQGGLVRLPLYFMGVPVGFSHGAELFPRNGAGERRWGNRGWARRFLCEGDTG